METHRWNLRLVLVLGALLLTQGGVLARDSVVTTAMAGKWEGNAQVIMVWCQQTNMPVVLDIQPDGTVTGKVGDATLSNARLRRNRGWLGQKLNLKTDYIIVGDLQGAIVAPEGITRSQVKMPFNWRSGTIAGGLHTSGTKFGGKDRGILSAGLTLRRANNP